MITIDHEHDAELPWVVNEPEFEPVRFRTAEEARRYCEGRMQLFPPNEELHE